MKYTLYAVFTLKGHSRLTMHCLFKPVTNANFVAMKKIYFLLLLFTAASISAQTTSVLWLGNSYTAVNNLPQLFYDLALSGGDTVVFDSNTPGGYTFQGHATNSTSIQKIYSQPWDYVVLQAQSQEPSFPPAQVQTQTMPYARVLDSLILNNDSCTETVFYMTWGRKYGDQNNCGGYPPLCTFEGMQARLRESYLQMANDNHAIVAPAGMAWKASRTLDSLINLWSADNSHPSIEGSYLTACVFYATIFRKSPIGLSYSPLSSSNNTTFLQTIAHDIVFDSLETWNTEKFLPQAGFSFTGTGGSFQFTNLSQNYTSFLWNFGDGTTSATSGSHSYTNSGNYPVSLYVYNDCGNTDTSTQTITVNAPNSITGAENKAVVHIFPNPCSNGFVTLQTDETQNNTLFSIVNILGEKVLSGKCSTGFTTIDVSAVHTGIYFLLLNQSVYRLHVLNHK